MSLGEILDRAFQIYRARFWVFIGIAAIPVLTYLTFSTTERVLLLNLSSGKKVLFHMTLSSLVSLASSIGLSEFLWFLAYPAFVYAAARTINGLPSDFRLTITAVRIRVRAYLALNLALIAIKILLPAVLFISSAIGLGLILDSKPSVLVKAGAYLLFVVFASTLVGFVVWMNLSLSLSFPATVLERITWRESLMRSFLLTKGGRIRIAMTYTLYFFVAITLMLLLMLSITLMTYMMHIRGMAWHGYPLYKFIISLGTAVISTFLGPIYPIALTLLYYDQRIRNEGYDIERMMEAAGLNAPVTSTNGDSSIAPIKASGGVQA